MMFLSRPDGFRGRDGRSFYMKRIFVFLLCAAVAFSAFSFPVLASSATLETTLSDNYVQRGSRKTFEVRARDASGKKINSTVLLNGESVAPVWDDNEKTSYTLVFTKEGENTVAVSAAAGQKTLSKTYKIKYVKANKGEVTGRAVWSVEAFTVGGGYIVEPVSVPIYEGETAADGLLRLLKNSGYTAYYGGSSSSSFYLAYIADGGKTAKKFNGYARGESPSSPKKLDLKVNIPEILVPHLKKTMTFFEPNDYVENWEGYLGEFALTNGSGWMYSVNNIYPNVGFADTYLSDGDVVRVRFTLGYGADIGGFGSVGTDIPNAENQPTGAYFAVANGDSLTVSVARALASEYKDRENVASALSAAIKTLEKLNASQSELSAARGKLENALSAPSPDRTDATAPTDPLEDPTSAGRQDASTSAEGTDNNTSVSPTSADGEEPTSPEPTAENGSPSPTGNAPSENGDSENGGGLALPVKFAIVCAVLIPVAILAALVIFKKRASRNTEKKDEK